MSPKSRTGRINIDLGAFKARWLSYCAAHNVTPSQAFRQVVAKLTADDGPSAAPGVVEQGQRKIRKVIRLTPDEIAKITVRASADGYSVSRWLVALIRARVYAAPQLGQPELAGLAKSNLLLLAVGRNLNQIARAVNVTGATNRRVPDDKIAELRAIITDHTDLVAAVLARNMERWSTS
jgi:hypothetical protein